MNRKKMVEYKICKRCIMDTTSDPNLVLDDDGVCNYCRNYDRLIIANEKNKKFDNVEHLFEYMKKESKDLEYDCVLGISGGVDSSYLAYLARQYDLRVLAVHVDAGWNSELAVKNIENMCRKLNLELHTLVVDWNLMKELQRAYLFSGLANQDVPQDQSYTGTYRIAAKNKVKFALNGFNLQTEGILSNAFQQTAFDWINIKDVYKKCGRGYGNINKFPHQSLFDEYVRYPLFHRMEKIAPLNYVDYSKKHAIEVLEKEFDWKYYGCKHYESRFTKFYQETYLPQRFGWEKRRDHLSSLVVGGEMTREEAIAEISSEPTTEHTKEEEKSYVLKKLDISQEEFEAIVSMPFTDGSEFKSIKGYKEKLRKIKIIDDIARSRREKIEKRYENN